MGADKEKQENLQREKNKREQTAKILEPIKATQLYSSLLLFRTQCSLVVTSLKISINIWILDKGPRGYIRDEVDKARGFH